MIILIFALILLVLLAGLGFTGLSLREQSKLSVSGVQNQTNLEAFEAQVNLLKDEKERGLVTDDLYQQLLKDLERKLLGDVPEQSSASNTAQLPLIIQSKYLVGVAVICAMLAMVVYFFSFFDADVWQRYQDIDQYHGAAAQSVQEGKLMAPLQDLPLGRLVPVLQSYALQDLRDPNRWYFLGQLFLSLEQAQLAQVALKRAYLINRDLAMGMAYLQAKLRLNQGQLNDDSDRVLQELSVLAEGDPQFILLQAAIYHRSGRYEEAVRLWSSLVDRSHDNLSGSAQEGAALIQGYIDDAKRKVAAQEREVSSLQSAVNIEILIPQEILNLSGYLWVVAKNINDTGPPLAVKKIEMQAVNADARQDDTREQFVYAVSLSVQDAMIPELTIKTQKDVLVKAMISASGTLETASNAWVSVERLDWQENDEVISLSLSLD